MLNVVGWATAIGTVVIFDFKNLCQCRFDKGRGHAQPCRHPHPKDRARPANADGRGDTRDITRTDATGQTGGKCLERTDLIRVFGFGECDLCRAFERAKLYETKAHGEIDPHRKQQINQYIAPEDVVDGVNDVVQCLHGCVLLCGYGNVLFELLSCFFMG